MVTVTRQGRFIHAAVVLTLFGITLVSAFEVRLGPSENFKQHSQVIFWGESFALRCLVPGVTRMNITNFSLYLNETLVLENNTLIVNDFSRRPLTNGYEVIINNVSTKHVGEYTCRVMIGMEMKEGSYNFKVETKCPRCITNYCKEEDNFELICYARILDDEKLANSFRWEVFDNEGIAMPFLDFQIQALNSGPKIVSYTRNRVKIDDSVRYYSCIVFDGQGNSNETTNEKICFFDLRNLMSSTSVPVATTDSVPWKTDVLKMTTTHQGEFVNDDRMEDNNSNIVVVIVLLGFVVLTLCVLVIIYLLVKRNLEKEKAKSESRLAGDLNFNSDTVPSFTFTNYGMDPRTQQLSEAGLEAAPVAYYDASTIPTVSVKPGPAQGAGRSGPDITTPYEEVNLDGNDTKGAVQHRDNDDVNQTSTDHVDYECIKEKNEGEAEIHYHVLDPSEEDT